MVRIIKKKSDTPQILKTTGAAEIKLLKAMTKGDLLKYKFKSSIYGHKDVKNTLITIQQGKCCFCEANVTAVSHGDVEHFRPKGGWMQKDKEKLTQPGYYWLAYDFDNLYLSCQICNQTFKKNYFPLQNPNNRVSKPGSLTKENPLLIDPGKIDPSQHLKFNKEIIVGKTPAGDETIKRAGLNRKATIAQRFEYYSIIETISILAKQPTPDGKKAKAQLKRLKSSSKIYSLMISDNF